MEKKNIAKHKVHRGDMCRWKNSLQFAYCDINNNRNFLLPENLIEKVNLTKSFVCLPLLVSKACLFFLWKQQSYVQQVLTS